MTQFGIEEIGRRLADEVGDENVGRRVIEIVAAAELLQLRVAHHRHAVGQRQRLDLIVGDVDHRLLQFLMDGFQIEEHLELQMRVDMAHDLVQDENRRVPDQRPAQADPLLLAAGQRPRTLPENIVDAQHLRDFPRLLFLRSPSGRPRTSSGKARFSSMVKFG